MRMMSLLSVMVVGLMAAGARAASEYEFESDLDSLDFDLFDAAAVGQFAGLPQQIQQANLAPWQQQHAMRLAMAASAQQPTMMPQIQQFAMSQLQPQLQQQASLQQQEQLTQLPVMSSLSSHPVNYGASLAASLAQQPSSSKQVSYAAPIVTVAQPIMQQADMTPPKLQKQHLTAQAIVQPTYQVAPEQRMQAISAQAPVMQKGFGTSVGLGTYSRLNQAHYPVANQQANLKFSQAQTQAQAQTQPTQQQILAQQLNLDQVQAPNMNEQQFAAADDQFADQE